MATRPRPPEDPTPTVVGRLARRAAWLRERRRRPERCRLNDDALDDEQAEPDPEPGSLFDPGDW